MQNYYLFTKFCFNFAKYFYFSMPLPQLSLVLPIYNPHEGWEAELLDSFEQIGKVFEGIDYKIVLVNDGSPTDLSTSLAQLQASEPRLLLHGYAQNRGKGHAIRHGIKQEEARYYIYTDWDFPFGFDVLRKVFDLLQTEKHELILSRRGLSYFRAIPFKRKVISTGVRLANYVLTGFKVGDTQAGLKGLGNKARDMLLTTTTDSFIFEFEFIRMVLRHKLAYTSVEVNPKPNIIMSDFKFKTIKKELVNYIRLCFGNNR